MFNTFMSYLSRFSRAILVVLAVFVVVALLGFTINSAADDKEKTASETTSETTAVNSETTESESSSTTTTSEEIETATGSTVVTYDAEDGETAIVVVSEEAVATITEQGNPQNYGNIEASEITIDSSDTVTVVTVDEEGNLQSETGQVSSTISGEVEFLPNTGLSNVAMTAIGLMAVSAAFVSYVSGRQNLAKSALRANR